MSALHNTPTLWRRTRPWKTHTKRQTASNSLKQPQTESNSIKQHQTAEITQPWLQTQHCITLWGRHISCWRPFLSDPPHSLHCNVRLSATGEHASTMTISWWHLTQHKPLKRHPYQKMEHRAAQKAALVGGLCPSRLLQPSQLGAFIQNCDSDSSRVIIVGLQPLCFQPFARNSTCAATFSVSCVS